MRRGKRSLRRRLGGAETMEFALVGPVVIVLIFAILAFGVASWQRSSIDYELATMAESLPAGWSTKSDEELVRELVLSGADLDPDRLEVSNASVKTRDTTEAAQGDSVAAALGSNVAYWQSRWLDVDADVTYRVSGGFDLGGPMEYTRHVSGTYLLTRRYEVS